MLLKIPFSFKKRTNGSIFRMKSLENTGATPKWLKKAVTDTAVICLCHSLLKSFGGTSRNFFSNPTKKTVCVFLNRPRIV